MISMKQLRIKKDTALRTFWINYNTLILKISIALMSIAAIVWLGYEFWRFFWQPHYLGNWQIHPGAIDLHFRYKELSNWFASIPVYTEMNNVIYPPASYLMLWPFLGWLEFEPAKLLWAVTSVAALCWLIYIIIQESGAHTSIERIFIALIPLSMYATGATIGNGQLILHISPFLITGILLINKEGNHLMGDLASSFMILFSLVKPTVSAPFFWLVLFRPGRLRPAVLVVVGYILLTLIAVVWQQASQLQTNGPEHDRTTQNNFPSIFKPAINFLKTGISASIKAGESNLSIWMMQMGLKEWGFPASLILLLLLGLWIFLNRTTDIWILLGVTAIVARFWTYHRWYDDLLILLPMVGLFRLAKSSLIPHPQKISAGIILGLTMVLMIAPGGLYLLPNPLNMIWVNLQSVGNVQKCVPGDNLAERISMLK